MGRFENRQQRTLLKRIWNCEYPKNFLLKIILFAFVFCLIGLFILNIFIWTSDVSKLDEPLPQPTFIYDQKGEVASKISNSTIDGVKIKRIPSNAINAFVATEDQRFYHHHGINYVGIARAMVMNVTSGGIVAGGSTITQQLAKNAFLTQERTYTRKFKELILTKKIERTYTKDEIIERYLNQIYFGEGAWGIQRASQTYFAKDVNQLTLSESALLAGLVKAPSNLNPINNYEKAIERRNLVLSLMKSEGYISQSDFEEAINQEVKLATNEVKEYKGKYPHYVDHIIDEAINKYHLTPNEVLSGGLHIYTGLNPSIQNAVDEVYKDDQVFPESKEGQLIQSGAIFINPSTGEINALVGGRGEHTFRQFNRATQLKRQPGSIMKPLSVYTPALEQGYDMYDRLEDKPINIEGYQPQNYDKQFRGDVSMYDAVIHSYNLPAVWLLQKIGIEVGANAVERFGIPLEQKDHIPGLALGGMNEGTSPLKMAQAFTTFPNNGVMVEAHSIQRIENADGEILGEWERKEQKVTEPLIAQKMTFMLKGVVNEGTGSKAQITGREIAGKTGTTQLPFPSENGAKDHWFVGYTPQVVGAIWLGYDKTDQNHYLSSSSSGTATVIFKEILAKAENEMSKKEFDLALLGNKYKQNKKRKKQDEKDNNNQHEKEDTKKEKMKAQKEREKENKKIEKEREKENKKREKEREKDKKEKEKKDKNE
ncbi:MULTISPECIES: transglycosylase domain-containing protein [Metabacillus]|uniref:Penicillin-binding protein n=2 Tax=Metabacillus TaxID=2675233 RepID=A0A179SMG3_9BACI|nr:MULTISPECIES: PBP1A family penicillin-binding protein [Metabacillus]OAS82847.1 penicillin-binding protein [Metabacillus litoralis]QNF30291.1 PBP1A family penicillin-binding protein [Metabacillus sp. KUDC1714]